MAGRFFWGLVLFFIITSVKAQQGTQGGVHIFSDTTFTKTNIIEGWTQPDSLFDGLRAVVYFHDGIKYFKYKDDHWLYDQDSLYETCQGVFNNYNELKKTNPLMACQIVRVKDFKDTIQNKIYLVTGGLFLKDSLGTEDRGTVIASDSSGVMWRRIHGNDIFPDWWSGVKDSKKIQKAVSYAGNGGKVVFTNREYVIDDEIFLDSLQNLHLNGRKATLKAAPGAARNATLSAPYNEGSYSIEVESVPASWEPGDILILIADQTNDGTSGTSQIDSITGNTVYLKYYFTSQFGGLFPSQPAGKKVIKNINIVRGKPSEEHGGLGSAGYNKGTIIENFIFDGNKQDENEVSLSWSVNNLIALHGRGSEIRSCKFINAPSEVITGHGINVHDNVFENCNGSVYHLSAHDTTFLESYPAYFVNNSVINCNTTAYNISGHNEGLISFSWNGGYVVVNGNYFVSGNSSNGVIGSLQGYGMGAHDREIVILSNNYCKGFQFIVFGSHQTSTRSLMITGNIFEDCTYLAPNPKMDFSVKVCGNVQVGTTNFGIDFRNSCQYQAFIDQSLGYGKNSLSSTDKYYNSAFGNYSLESTTSGDFNAALGNSAGKSNLQGNRNTFLGTWSGVSMTGGDDNTIVGFWARGSSISLSGDKNVHIGSEAGRSNNGDGNVFIGYSAGRYMEGSNQLVIHNNESNSPLIFGKFDERKVEINGSMSINGPNFFRLPRITNTERDNLIDLEGGEMIYNTSENKLQLFNGSIWIDLH